MTLIIKKTETIILELTPDELFAYEIIQCADMSDEFVQFARKYLESHGYKGISEACGRYSDDGVYYPLAIFEVTVERPATPEEIEEYMSLKKKIEDMHIVEVDDD